jgi:hypothetical protein
MQEPEDSASQISGVRNRLFQHPSAGVAARDDSNPLFVIFEEAVQQIQTCDYGCMEPSAVKHAATCLLPMSRR